MLKDGLYEQVINESLQKDIDESVDKFSEIKEIDKAESSKILSQYITDIIEKGLNYISDDNLSDRVSLINKIVSVIKEETEDEEGFLLEKDISELKVPYNVKEKGIDYFLDGRVIYLSVDGDTGKAIVDGTNIYEIEFTYKNGEVSNFICDCYRNYARKHTVAVIMQLKNILKNIEENYKEEYRD